MKKNLANTSEIYYYEDEYVIYFNTISDHIEKLIPYDYYLSRKADEGQRGGRRLLDRCEARRKGREVAATLQEAFLDKPARETAEGGLSSI